MWRGRLQGFFFALALGLVALMALARSASPDLLLSEWAACESRTRCVVSGLLLGLGGGLSNVSTVDRCLAFRGLALPQTARIGKKENHRFVVAMAIIDSGVSPNCEPPDGERPIHSAIIAADTDFVLFLLRNGAAITPMTDYVQGKAFSIQDLVSKAAELSRGRDVSRLVEVLSSATAQ